MGGRDRAAADEKGNWDLGRAASPPCSLGVVALGFVSWSSFSIWRFRDSARGAGVITVINNCAVLVLGSGPGPGGELVLLGLVFGVSCAAGVNHKIGRAHV